MSVCLSTNTTNNKQNMVIKPVYSLYWCSNKHNLFNFRNIVISLAEFYVQLNSKIIYNEQTEAIFLISTKADWIIIIQKKQFLEEIIFKDYKIVIIYKIMNSF